MFTLTSLIKIGLSGMFFPMFLGFGRSFAGEGEGKGEEAEPRVQSNEEWSVSSEIFWTYQIPGICELLVISSMGF